jgi:hypothetical protein
MEQNIYNIITTAVLLGNPDRNCQGHGICTVETLHSQPSICKCPSIQARIQACYDGRIQFVFFKSTIPSAVIERHFSSGLFVVENAFEISPALGDKICTERKSIEPGYYAIQETDFSLVVTF